MDAAHQPLFIPVRDSGDGMVAPQIARLPEGPRTGIAFTSATALAQACRPGQPWIRLSETALRALLSPLGITHIQVDPALIAADLSRPTYDRNVPVSAPSAKPEVAVA